MKYRYPKSINTPEGRKIYRRLRRKITRQTQDIREQSKTILEQIDYAHGLKKDIAEKDKYIRRIRVGVGHITAWASIINEGRSKEK